MKPPMLHTAYKHNYTRNAYGDFIRSSKTELNCHFRYINDQISDTNNEQIQSDAMAWFEPDSGIDRKDIIEFENEFYRVEQITKARTLRSTDVQFIKCDLLKYGVIS
jgi:hypothetical protein